MGAGGMNEGRKMPNENATCSARVNGVVARVGWTRAQSKSLDFQRSAARWARASKKIRQMAFRQGCGAPVRHLGWVRTCALRKLQAARCLEPRQAQGTCTLGDCSRIH